jgi:hypothetical protein
MTQNTRPQQPRGKSHRASRAALAEYERALSDARIVPDDFKVLRELAKSREVQMAARLAAPTRTFL